MSTSAKDKTKPAQMVKEVAGNELRKVVFNLPNQLTWGRLLLTVVMFAMASYGYYAVALWLFIVAASTDWLDGYYARKYNQVTTLGRILDPFADKVIICGTFIYLCSIPALAFYVRPWMAVVVVGRELLVTALRSFLEQRGSDFSATMSGKIKMVLQCIAAGTALFSLAYYSTNEKLELPTWLHWVLLLTVWSAVISTVHSGIGYIHLAIRLLRR